MSPAVRSRGTFLAAMLLSSSVLAAEDPPVLVEVFQGRGFLTVDEVEQAPREDAEWVGLFERAGQTVLERARVSVSDPVPNECLGGFDVLLQVQAAEGLRFVATGITNLKPREVRTAFLGRLVLEPGARLELSLPPRFCAEDACTVVESAGRWADSAEGRALEGYTLSLQDRGRRQVVFAQPDYFLKPVWLLWAGDLDGDGRLDLLLNTNYHPEASGLSLYLSSHAAAGALVGLVAEQNPDIC